MKGYRKIGVYRGVPFYATDSGGIVIERRIPRPPGRITLALAFPFRGELKRIYDAVKNGQVVHKLTAEEFYGYLNAKQREALCLYKLSSDNGQLQTDLTSHKGQ